MQGYEQRQTASALDQDDEALDKETEVLKKRH